MARRRVTYRPSKAQGAFGMVWGGIFVLIGLVVVIPTFGPFGILWTLAALGITVMNGLHAFGKKYVGPEIRIEDEEGSEEGAEAFGQQRPSSPAPEGGFADLDFHILRVNEHIAGNHAGDIFFDQFQYLRGTVDPIRDQEDFQTVFRYFTGCPASKKIRQSHTLPS